MANLRAFSTAVAKIDAKVCIELRSKFFRKCYMNESVMIKNLFATEILDSACPLLLAQPRRDLIIFKITPPSTAIE